MSRVKHGMYGTRVYNVWAGMVYRCKANNKYSRNYHDRGIEVCKEWRASFINFYNWAFQAGYRDDLQIDRIDNDKGYFPENCRFVTAKVNCLNRRNNKLITINGVTKSITEWGEASGVSRATLGMRISRGWPVEQLLNLTQLRGPKKKEAFL